MFYIGKRIKRGGLSVKEEESREKRRTLERGVILRILEQKERRKIREKRGRSP